MPAFVDDKSRTVIPFIVSSLAQHRRRSTQPFVVALNGVQGAGKTTLVTALQQTLSSPPHSLPTLSLSIDDLYLPRNRQQALAEAHPLNPLVQHRGQPGTHDVSLGMELLSKLKNREPDVSIPAYDKSAFNGKGDRVHDSKWQIVNQFPTNAGSSAENTIEVVLFEGWCVGFTALSNSEVESRWRTAKEAVESSDESVSQLGRLRLQDVLFVNDALKDYDALNQFFDVLAHIDAEDPVYVYEWRSEQEAKLRVEKGSGMTDQQVVEFVNAYYPSYELYTDRLRAGVFGDRKGRQLRLVMGRDRRVKYHEVI